MLDVLKHLCQTLEDTGIPYMLSGSMALNVYTIPRMTMDIDVVLGITAASAEGFISALENDFFVDDEVIQAEVRRQGMFNLVHKKTAVRIDCIVQKHTPFRQAEMERRQYLDMGGFSAYVASIEDLILSKLIWIQDLQSEKQMEDLRQLLASRRADLAYIRHWVERLHLKTFDLL
ncbi:MAG: hypothetical protein D6722_27255 [Bacteroidetes bacterium]|nr:MAG: hypothetical protein D6722_27255 [Bacteroidota bacterium]